MTTLLSSLDGEVVSGGGIFGKELVTHPEVVLSSRVLTFVTATNRIYRLKNCLNVVY